MPMQLRTPYNYDRNKASDETALTCTDKSRTKQSFKDECDINVIMKRFNVTGKLPDNIRVPQYGDFTNATDYHSALNAVRGAAENFALLPSNIRKQFDHDAGKFVDFCLNPDNKEELKKLGLLRPELLQAELPNVVPQAGAPNTPQDPPSSGTPPKTPETPSKG